MPRPTVAAVRSTRVRDRWALLIVRAPRAQDVACTNSVASGQWLPDRSYVLYPETAVVFALLPNV
jgi:hypothetical protein